MTEMGCAVMCNLVPLCTTCVYSDTHNPPLPPLPPLLGRQLAGYTSPMELAIAYLDAAQASLERQEARRGAGNQVSSPSPTMGILEKNWGVRMSEAFQLLVSRLVRRWLDS